MKQLSKIMRMKRNENNLSVQDLADILKYSKQYISRIEIGDLFPSYEFLKSWCEYFKMNLNMKAFYVEFYEDKELLKKKFNTWKNK